jgi:hypothetical protein
MRVEFYLTSVMEISHLAPVVRALRERGVDAVFVSDRVDAVFVFGQRSDVHQYGYYDADQAEAVLDGQHLPFVSRYNPDADLALTIQTAEYIGMYRKRKARVMYGVGVVAPETYLRASTGGFDFYLVPGYFSLLTQFQYHGLPSAILPHERVKVVGYPRLDTYFNLPALDIRAKPMILYLPSWSNRSSINRLVGPLSCLLDRFTVIAKPHHLTALREPDRVDMLRSAGIQVSDHAQSPHSLLAAADLVIADLSSGAYTEAILAQKKVLGITTLAERPRLLVPAIGNLPMCFADDDVGDAVERALRFDWLKRDVERLRSYLFDTSEGSDAARAADAIVSAIK